MSHKKIYVLTEEHKRDVLNIAKTANSKKGTALVVHIAETGHDFNFNSKEIMKKVRYKRTLKIEEANHIILLEDTAVNLKKDAAHISPVFYNLIKNSKRKKRPVNPSRRMSNMVSLEHNMFNG